MNIPLSSFLSLMATVSLLMDAVCMPILSALMPACFIVDTTRPCSREGWGGGKERGGEERGGEERGGEERGVGGGDRYMVLHIVDQLSVLSHTHRHTHRRMYTQTHTFT